MRIFEIAGHAEIGNAAGVQADRKMPRHELFRGSLVALR